MTTINVRVEEKTKKAATRVLEDMGLDLSSGVKIFLAQVIREKGLPFTPTANAAQIRARWDREGKEARKGKGYASAKELLDELK